MKLSIIIPGYNEENSLEEIVGKVVETSFSDIDKEIVISNDGSTDHTIDIIQKQKNIYPDSRISIYALLHDLVVIIPVFILWARYSSSRILLYTAINVYIGCFIIAN